MSPLCKIMDVASKILVPLGRTSSRESDSCSRASSVALADLRFSCARCSMMLTFSRVVRSLLATWLWVSPVALSRITCHCLCVSTVLGDLKLVNHTQGCGWPADNVIVSAYQGLWCCSQCLLSYGFQKGLGSIPCTPHNRAFDRWANSRICNGILCWG